MEPIVKNQEEGKMINTFNKKIGQASCPIYVMSPSQFKTLSNQK